MRCLLFILMLTLAFVLALSGCAMQEKRASSTTVQKYVWTRRMGGTGDNYAYSICTDALGNVYVAGYFGGGVNFAEDWGGNDTKTNAYGGYNDIFVMKIHSDGTYGWTRRMDGWGYGVHPSICTDAGRNVYVAGHFISSSVNFAEDWGGRSAITFSAQRLFFASSSDKTRAMAAGMSRAAEDHHACRCGALEIHPRTESAVRRTWLWNTG